MTNLYVDRISKLEAEIKELEEGATQQSEVYESEIANLEAENKKLKDALKDSNDIIRIYENKLAILKKNVEKLKTYSIKVGKKPFEPFECYCWECTSFGLGACKKNVKEGRMAYVK